MQYPSTPDFVSNHWYGGWGQVTDVRAALYMATLSAVRRSPEMKAHCQQLRARGKVAKVALVACMRKLLTIVNAHRRDEIKAHEGHVATV